MARPLRLEFDAALYHVTSPGKGSEDIYLSDGDRQQFLEVLGDVRKRFNWTVHAHCLMTTNYCLLVETTDANLPKGKRHAQRCLHAGPAPESEPFAAAGASE